MLVAAIAMAVPNANAAGSIVLTPSAANAGASIDVSGSGFGATKAVGLGFGAEVAASDANMAYSGTGMGPYTGRLSNYPIKPGSFVLTSDTSSGAGMVSTYTDNGDGTTSGSFEGAVGTINYITGVWTRITTVDVTGIAANYSATYTRYQYNVTSITGITTTATGTFSANMTAPSVSSGTYVVTAIDASGNRAFTNLSVTSTIPEGLNIGAMMIVSSIAVIVGTLYLRKRPKISQL